MSLQKPNYPVYIISKGRFKNPYTATFFMEDNVDFKIVIEKEELADYKKVIPEKYIIVLPFSNQGAVASRNFCQKDSIKKGFSRYWIFDDNIVNIRYLNHGKRIRINSNIALHWVEQFTDRYTNIGISGFNYKMFVMDDEHKPYRLNTHVYSAMLISNEMPYRWRLKFNADTDLCLQVLANGLCTVAFNVFCADKLQTMKTKGGNTDRYQGKGRLVMARTLEEVWPQYVKTKIRFGRPQHFIKDNWRCFKQKLIRRTDIDFSQLKCDFSVKLVETKPVKSNRIKNIIKKQNGENN